MEKILIHIPLHLLQEESYFEHILSLNLERTALLIKNRHRNTSDCKIYITLGRKKDNLLELDSVFFNENKYFIENHLLLLLEEYQSPTYITKPSHLHGYSTIYTVIGYEDEFTDREHILEFKEKEALKAKFLGGLEAKEFIHLSYIIIRVNAYGFSVYKIKVKSTDQSIFDYLYPTFINSTFIISNPDDLSNRDFFNFSTQSISSSSQLINHPYRSEGASNAIYAWPVFDCISSTETKICTSTIFDSLGNVPINDFGPNHTTHGYRTNLPTLFDSSRESLFNIVLLGGSFLYGHNLPTKRTIASNLERLLNDRTHSSKSKATVRFSIHDLSCPKDNLLNSFTKLLHLNHLIKPNAIIAIGGLNDLIQMYHSPAEDHTPQSSYITVFNKSLENKSRRNLSPQEIQLRLKSTFDAIEGFAHQIGALAILHLQPWLDFKPFFNHDCPNMFTSSLAYGKAQCQRKYDKILEDLPRSGSKNISSNLTPVTINLLNKYDPRSLFIDKCHTTALGAKLYSEVIYSDFVSKLKNINDLSD